MNAEVGIHKHHRMRHHVLLCYKNFSGECNVSHIGLGVTAQYTAKTLMQHDIFAQAVAIKGADELIHIIESYEDTRPVTHVDIMAQWIPTHWLARLCRRFPTKSFALTCHSNIGFLQAEPPAIKLFREAIDLQTGVSNFSAACNNLRTATSMERMFGQPVTFLPNLYYIHGKEPIHRPIWSHGDLRVGIFGSHRIQKNFSTCVAAAVQLAQELKCHMQIFMNSGRHDGAGNVVTKAAEKFVENLPNVALQAVHWQSWPEFKRTVGAMNLLFQVSYTETFNNVTADGVCEGVPSVVSDTIDWCPESWMASCDDSSAVAGVARRLLFDQHAARDGFESLKKYVRHGVPYWVEWLSRMPGGET